MRPPTVVLVPGFGGSVLRAPTNPDTKNSWLSLRSMTRSVDSWLEGNRVYYDYANRTYFSENTLEVQDFGGHDGVRDIIPELDWVEWFDIGQCYYGGLIDDLADHTNVVGAPYDFRTVLGEGFEDFRMDLKRLIEENKPVVVVAHSLGAVLVRSILSDWWFTRRCVTGVVEVCPAHGGSLNSFEIMQDGSFYIPIPAHKKNKIASSARSLAGLIATLPNCRAHDVQHPLWIDEAGKEYYSGHWQWPEVQDAWQHLALPVLRSSVDLPRSVAHVVLHSTKHETPVFLDKKSGKIKNEGGDGVLTAASMLSRTCDHTHIRHMDCIHRMAPSDPATLDAVHKFL